MSEVEITGCPTEKPTKRVGTTMKGENGNIWMIKTINKKKEWVEFTSHKTINHNSEDNTISKKKCETKSYVSANKIKQKSYLIHDNGGRPFQVKVNKTEINVFTHGVNDTDNGEVYDVPVLTITGFLGYWNGYDPAHKQFVGNSILVQLDAHTYISIGCSIQLFKTEDVIYDYYSEVCGSDVPYPVALGENNVYFMLDMKLLKNELIPKTITPLNMYGYYYGHIKVSNDPLLQEDNKKKKKSPSDFATDVLYVETLQERS